MLLELRDLSVSYGKAVALENISMHIAAGEFMPFSGPTAPAKAPC